MNAKDSNSRKTERGTGSAGASGASGAEARSTSATAFTSPPEKLGGAPSAEKKAPVASSAAPDDSAAAGIPPTVREAAPAALNSSSGESSATRRPSGKSSGASAPRASYAAVTFPTAAEPPLPPTNGAARLSARPLPDCPVPELSRWAEALQAPPSNPDSAWPRLDGFELIAKLGSAGQGDVYLARDRELQADVAIKVPKSLNAEAQEQFLSEARALAKVRHRNIVGIRRFGRSGQQVFFVMDVVRGPDAAALVRVFRDAKAHRLDAARILQLAGVDPVLQSPELRRAASQSQPYYRLAATWIAEAAEGLYAAHRADIYHRDVKPSNLLLERDGRLMVSDFGLAKSSEEVSRSGGLGVTGTYPYIPPERALGEWARVDHRADLWALGATLYEFLTYQRAYPRGGKEVLQDIVAKDPIPPRNVIGAVPAALEAICLKAMARDPDGRYPTAADMAADLRAWAAGRKPKPVGWLVLLGIAAVVLGGAAALYESPAARVRCEQWLSAIAARMDSPAQPPRDPKLGDVPEPKPEQDGVPAATSQPASRPADPQPTGESGDPAKPEGPQAGDGAETNDKPPFVDPPLPPDDKPPVDPPVPSAPRVFLAFSEDLNAAAGDPTPPRAGGKSQSRFADRLQEAKIDMVYAGAAPADWNEPAAIAAAAAAGANFVLFGTVRAVPLETKALSSGVAQQTWDVRLKVRLIEIQAESGRVSVRKVWLDREYPPPQAVSRKPESSFGGDVMKQANEACADVLGELRKISPAP
jgi:serine/threonine protein kinase